ncbi:MAG TPA: DoxX family protein [Candidatus Paceibacterota bacterium]|nr:DoxX family protein [Candidatus Paceibacterota bacterium]
MELLNRVSRFWYRPSLGLLLIRVTLGAIFIHHGLMKFENLGGTAGFMMAIGLPGFMAYAITFVEIVGGAMLALGIAVRAAAVATGIAMLVALALAVLPKRGFSGGEFEILLAATSFGLALIGAGRLRLTHIFEHDRE